MELMGRITYETIQKYDKNLTEPYERLNTKKVVLTHDKDFRPKAGYEVVYSLEEAVK